MYYYVNTSYARESQLESNDMYVVVFLTDLRKLAIDLLSVTLIIWTWAFHRFVCALSSMYYYVNTSNWKA